MKKLYLPTSSLNFNNIFSSETISPISFYSRRNFGYKRFEAVEPNPFQNSLILYSTYPKFEIKDYEKDNYPIIFEISKELLSDKILFIENIDGVDIFQLSSSVYLNPFEIKVYFVSESNLHTTIIKSESSLETKLVSVYKSCFVVENKSIEKFVWSKRVIENIKDINESESINSIELDKKVNRIKGFTYCYLIGANSNLPSEILELKRLLKDIKNIISGLINIYHSNSSSKKNYIPKDTFNEIKNRLEELNIKVSRFINLSEIIDPQKQNALDFEKATLKKFDLTESEIQKVFIFLKSFNSGRYSLYEHFQWAIQTTNQSKKENTWIANLEQLALFINNLFSKTDSSQQYFKIEDVDKVIEQIEETLLKFESSFREQNRKLNIDEAFVLSNLRLTSLFDSYLKGKTEFYQGLINTLIDIPIDNFEHFKTSKVDITLSCGKFLKEYITDWENSKERLFINSLLDNIESYKPFNLKSHSSEILQSFAAFIIKGDEPDKLMDFLIANSIKDFRISLGLWGASFGFASIPRTLTENFLTSDTTYICTFFKTFFKQIFNYEVSGNVNLSILKEPVLAYDKENLRDVKIVKQTNTPSLEKSIAPFIDEIVENKKSVFQEKVLCPECNSEMKLKNGKFGDFYGCSKFPDCKGTRQLKDLVTSVNVSNNLSSIIIEFINRNGHSKISDVLGYVKEKMNKSYNVGGIENYIKQNLLVELELKKKERSSGVKFREKGIFS